MNQQALLVMDVQKAVLDRYPDPDYLARLHKAIDAARTDDIPVIYAVVGFRSGFPEVSARNKMFGALASAPATTARDGRAIQVHPDVAPEPGDILVTKRRVSAFAGSDLDMVLRARDIEHLILTGVATSGVVLSTLRQAADLDFGLTILSDGCLDADPDVHRLLTEKVFPQQADVMTIAEWSSAAQTSKGRPGRA